MMFNKVYECPNCNNSIKINLSVYESDTSSYERGMGAEIEHTFEGEGTCPHCGYEYSIEGSLWEYPVGAENLDETRIK